MPGILPHSLDLQRKRASPPSVLLHWFSRENEPIGATYSWPLNNTGLNCMGRFLCRFFFSRQINAAGLHVLLFLLIDFWLNRGLVPLTSTLITVNCIHKREIYFKKLAHDCRGLVSAKFAEEYCSSPEELQLRPRCSLLAEFLLAQPLLYWDVQLGG